MSDYKDWVPEPHFELLIKMDNLTPEFCRLVIPDFRKKLVSQPESVNFQDLTGEFYRYSVSKWDEFGLKTGDKAELDRLKKQLRRESLRQIDDTDW